MTKKQKVLKLASEMGVSAEIKGGRFFTVELGCPAGFQFGPELHWLVSEGECDGKSFPDAAWSGALKDLKFHKISPCPEDCPCRH